MYEVECLHLKELLFYSARLLVRQAVTTVCSASGQGQPAHLHFTGIQDEHFEPLVQVIPQRSATSLKLCSHWLASRNKLITVTLTEEGGGGWTA